MTHFSVLMAAAAVLLLLAALWWRDEAKHWKERCDHAIAERNDYRQRLEAVEDAANAARAALDFPR